MFGTLFFDEARVGTALRVRQTRQQATAATSPAGGRLHPNRGDARAAGQRCAFGCRGEVALPSLCASLLWWLDAEASVVQLLVVNDSASSRDARASQSRLLSVEVPTTRPGQLVTCGVTRNYIGDNGVAVVWVLSGDGVVVAGEESSDASQQRGPASCLTAGFAQVTVQRAIDNTGHSSLLLVPGEKMVECAPLSRIPGESFTPSEAGCRASACVVAELPQSSTARTASIVVLTDGARLWCAELFADGSVSVATLTDDVQRRNVLRSFCDANAEVRLLDTRTVAADLQRLASPAPAEEGGDGVEVAAAPSGTRWLRRFLSTSGPAGRNNNSNNSSNDSGSEDGLPALDLPAALRRRLYAAVSAVQQSPFVALTRWNGQVEVYEVSCGAMRLASQYPIGVVPPALLTPVAAGRHNTPYALPAGPTMQWATRNPTTQLLHVVTCLADRGEGRPCLWTALPLLPPPTALDGAVQGRAGEILAQYCTVTVVGPTLSSRALACAVSGDGNRLVVVSDIGCEEDAHLLCARSLAALTLPEAQMKSEGVATLVQVVEAEGDGGLQGLLRTGRLHAYLCQGAHMQGVVARGGAVVMIEQGVQPCRLFTLEDAAADALVQLTEGVVVGVEAEDVQGGAESDEGRNAVAVVDSQSSGDALGSPHCVHYVPLIETNPFTSAGGEAAGAADPLAVYWEGVSLIRSCAHGARFMATLLRDVLQSSSPVAELASLPRFLSEAHLSGYTASLQRSAPSTQSSALAAVRLALSPASAAGVPSTAQEFYTYSRLYATEAAMGKVLSRVTFLATAYLGWQSTQSVACAPAPHQAASQKDVTAPSTEWVTQQIVTALEVLVAAYHALPLAGPDAARLARVEDSAATQPTADAMVAALLPVFTPSSQSEPSSSRSASEVSAAAVVQVVNRLRRCGTPRTARACAAWVKQLTRRFPLLQHFQLLSLLETAAAPAQSAWVQACCEAVCHALACEPTAAVVELLFAEDFFLADAVTANGSGSAFHAVPSDELAAFVAAAPAVGPKLYAVGVLRRVTALGALFCTLNTSVTRGYLYATLMLCDEWVERLQRRAAASEQAPPFQRLRHAFAELRVDALLTSAQARVAQADMAGCFHDLQAALDLMPAQRCLPTYAEVVQRVLGTAVEVACASQANMRALLTATTIGAAQLEESLILKWYNYIARLPTKSASEATEALRYRAILGLHRYLMNHHSYAQCARLMSSLATLLRCSPLRRTATSGIAVSELAGLALHAATLIAPAVPMPEENRTSMTGSLVADAAGAEGHNASAAAATAAVAAGSPLSLGYSWRPSSISSSSPQPIDPTATDAAEVGGGAARWLTRADIPWLQRRLFQAQCERQLWRRGCTLDCTDLWVEGAPVDAVRRGVEKLVSALMQHRLWPQAFRFARLSELYDPCTVLEEWALDLLRSAQRSRKNSGSGSGAADTADAEAHAADRAEAWEEIVSYCRELSTLANQFTPFVRTVTTALTFSYEDVPSDLLAAHRQTDAYTAMSALFQVALVLRKRADTAAAVGAMGGMEDGDEDEDEERSAGGGEGLNGATPSVSSAASQPGGSRADNALTRKRDATDTAAAVAATRLNVWRALSAAARIAQELLQQQQQQQSGILHGMRMGGFAAEEEEQRAVGPRQAGSVGAARGVFSSFTAGVIDPMVVCANELMAAPVYRAGLPSVPGVQLNLERFLNSVSAVRA